MGSRCKEKSVTRTPTLLVVDRSGCEAPSSPETDTGDVSPTRFLASQRLRNGRVPLLIWGRVIDVLKPVTFDIPCSLEFRDERFEIVERNLFVFG